MGQSSGMYFTFLGEVLKRAFTPTPRLTDGLQIAAASALPALASFAGVEFHDGAQENVLAYIGLVALSFFVIRLFWAPYAIWKEHLGEIGELKLELTKPERMVIEHIAKHRAKARMRIASLLMEMHRSPTLYSKDELDAATLEIAHKIERQVNKAGLGPIPYRAILMFRRLCSNISYDAEENSDVFLYLGLIRYLHGELTDVDLERLLPPGTGPGTPQ